jgi:hypothetical protein
VEVFSAMLNPEASTFWDRNCYKLEQNVKKLVLIIKKQDIM